MLYNLDKKGLKNMMYERYIRYLGDKLGDVVYALSMGGIFYGLFWLWHKLINKGDLHERFANPFGVTNSYALVQTVYLLFSYYRISVRSRRSEMDRLKT